MLTAGRVVAGAGCALLEKEAFVVLGAAHLPLPAVYLYSHPSPDNKCLDAIAAARTGDGVVEIIYTCVAAVYIDTLQ